MGGIRLIPEAVEDYRGLDGSVRGLANKKIDSLKTNPRSGIALGNRDGIDLTGFYKLYFNQKKHRVVYRIIPEDTVEIWGIGKRDQFAIYQEVWKRKMRRQRLDLR